MIRLGDIVVTGHAYKHMVARAADGDFLREAILVYAANGRDLRKELRDAIDKHDKELGLPTREISRHLAGIDFPGNVASNNEESP